MFYFLSKQPQDISVFFTPTSRELGIHISRKMVASNASRPPNLIANPIATDKWTTRQAMRRTIFGFAINQIIIYRTLLPIISSKICFIVFFIPSSPRILLFLHPRVAQALDTADSKLVGLECLDPEGEPNV